MENTRKSNFIKKSKAKHGDKYSYDKTEYKGCNVSVIVTCIIHGDINVTPENFLKSKTPCKKCLKHHRASLISGRFSDKQKEQAAKITQPEDHKIIVTGSGYMILVDNEDFEYLNSYIWGTCNMGKLSKKRRAYNNTLGYMHRCIMNTNSAEVVDHINGEPLDNRKINLRKCSQAENARNNIVSNKKKSSRFKGVCWVASKNKWTARVMTDGKYANGGYFTDETKAAESYDVLAIKHHGEFAKLNLGCSVLLNAANQSSSSYLK